MTIVWSPRAIRHLSHLRRYIAQHNPQAANRIAVELVDAVERLAELPDLGTGELVVPGTRYVIPYRVRGQRVEVLAVFHGRQKWPKQL